MARPSEPMKPEPDPPAVAAQPIADSLPDSHLHWHRTIIDGRRAEYGEGGPAKSARMRNPHTVVFLHGWALGQHVYKRALKRLTAKGIRVLAPAMPGFGGTADLPRRQFDLPGYAAWVAEFIREVGPRSQVTLVGHSFGGGVAIQTAHDHPELVARLVVVNSIGGSAWRDEGGVLKTLSQRPIWDWGLHLRADVAPVRQLRRVLPVIAEDALPNLLRNPGAVWRVGKLARTANLTSELEEIRRRGLPVVVLWGERDTVIPALARDDMLAALGNATSVPMEGAHNWLLYDPAAFGEVMTTIVGLPLAGTSPVATGGRATSRKAKPRKPAA